MAKNCKYAGSIPRYALLLMLIAGGNAIAADTDSKELATPKVVDRAVVDTEIQTRSSVLDDIEAQYEALRAKKFSSPGEYRDASREYEQLIKMISVVPGTVAESKMRKMEDGYKDYRKEWSAFIYSEAKKLFEDKKYEEAIQMCSILNGIAIDGNADIAASFIDKCRKEIKSETFKKDINVKDEAFKNELSAIDRYMREAQTYYNNGKYTKVMEVLEKVYLLDPFNVRATTLLDKTYGKIYSMARARHRVTTQEAVAQVEWNWVMPVKNIRSSATMEKVAALEKPARSSVEDKLEKIIFEKFDSPGMDILKILNFLASKSKAFDDDPVRPGVDIIPQFKESELSAPKYQKIYMHFNNIPLAEILRYLCLNLGIKYKIDSYGNVLVGTNIDDIVAVSRKFDVRDDLIADILAGTSAAPAAAASEDVVDPAMAPEGEAPAEATASSSAGNSEVENKLKNYFIERGVDFPNNSRIIYNRRYHRLEVKNTEENLLRLDELLSQIQAIQVPMVMTEVKFVEVTEKDFNQLGFDWNFSLQDAGRDNGLWNFSSSTNFVSRDEQNTKPSAFIQNLNLLPNFDDEWGGLKPTLNVTVHALSQNDNVEVLTTPRLISKSGQTAFVKMVTETKYPEEWEAPTLETESDNITTISFPVPELSDEASPVGVTMTVTPTVSYDNSITLDLHPEIITFLGSDNSGYPVPVQEGYVDRKTGEMIPSMRNEVINIWMPEFGVRRIDAKVKVDDGETIVLGGIINSSVNRQEEKTPILGNIPLFGRLFQNRSEDSTKTNLLIFVTARLINSDGRPVSKDENSGTPHFNF